MALGISLLAGGCSKQPPAPANHSSPFRLTATIQEIMDSEVDPSADFIWDSVGSIVTKEGTEDKQPRTDEEWKEVRRKAIVMLEATNLLIMDGRRVSAAYLPPEGEGVFDSRQIQQKIDANHAGFVAYAGSLHDVGTKMLAAIDARDVKGLLDNGEALDEVCEACHTTYWYPNQVIPK